MHRMTVVFPDTDGPIIAVVLPSGNDSDMSFRTVTEPNRLVTRHISTINFGEAEVLGIGNCPSRGPMTNISARPCQSDVQGTVAQN